MSSPFVQPSIALVGAGRLAAGSVPAGAAPSQPREELVEDLLELAATVYRADRCRPGRELGRDGWSRRMVVPVGVRRLELWANADVAGRLTALLGFLTGDDWDLRFSPRLGVRGSNGTQAWLPLAFEDGPQAAALLSGGLDSLAGAAAHLGSGRGTLLLVSAAGSQRQAAAQRFQARALGLASAGVVGHVCVPYGGLAGAGARCEVTGRARGFLFLALGAAVALRAGLSELLLFENGVGAVNLPYDESQLGADLSRGVHPRTLRELGELVSALSGRAFRVVNRCVWATKGEMLAGPPVRALGLALRASFSCDGFPVRARGRSQCGFCTSCLLRRVSLEAAGLDDPPCGYLWDCRASDFPRDPHHQRGLAAMEWQALRLQRCLAASEPWPALCREFPALRAAARELGSERGQARAEAGLVRLYGRHVEEWRAFSGRGALARPEMGTAA